MTRENTPAPKRRKRSRGKSMYGKARSGKFTPKNPEKYSGNVDLIIYRSGLELKLFNYLDLNPAILSWVSEEDPIPYFNPVKEKVARYFYDVRCVFQVSGRKETVLVEVKSRSETVPPAKKKKITRRYVEAVMTWMVNDAKWKAARAFCKERGWHFRILTEDQLNYLGMNRP